MTTPVGGGANLGIAYGKVRIDYESSGAAKATKDVEALQTSLVQTGSAASKSAKQVAQAAETFKQTLKLPAGDVLLKPKSVRLDKASIDKAVQDWKQTAVKELSLGDFDVGLKANAHSLAVSAATAKELASAFEAGLKDGIRDAVREAMQVAGDGMEDGARRVEGKASRAGGRLAGAMGLALKGGIAGAAAAVVGGAGLVLQQGFSRITALDAAAAKLKALGLQTGEIAAVSKTALESVLDTAFGLDDAFSAAADAINAGIKPGKQLDTYLNALANTAALAGTSMTELGMALNDAAIQGKLTGDVVMSLITRQVPVFKLIAEEYGVTEQKAQQMVSNSEVSFERFVNAMSKNKEAARIMGNTITGSFKNMQAAIKRVGATLLAPIFGAATGEASTAALAIQAVTAKIKEFEAFLKDHKNEIIDFWVAFGKGALFASEIVVGVTSALIWLFGKLLKVVSFGARLLGKTELANSLSEFGDTSDEASKKIADFNKTLDKGYGKLDEFGKKAKDAKAPIADLGNKAEPEKLLSLAEALEKLGLKSDSATQAIEGTNKQFKQFIKTIKEKGGTQALIDQLTKLHERFNNGGRQVLAYADAIEQLGDSSVDASTKANDLIKALQGLDILPGGDSVAALNDKLREMTDWLSQIIDISDTKGNELVLDSGQLNTNFKNASALLKEIEEVRAKMVEVMTSGEATPEQAWEQTAKGLRDLLIRQAGLTPEMAEKVISTYLLTSQQWADQIAKKGDPKKALESLAPSTDPAKLHAALELLTTTEDLLKQLKLPEGVLIIPAKIGPVDTSNLPGDNKKSGGWWGDIPADRLPGKAKRGNLPASDAASKWQAPPEADWWKVQMGLLGEHFRWPNPPGTTNARMPSPTTLQQEQSLTELEKEALADPARVAAAWDQMDEITRIKLRALKEQAESSGKDLAQAYAEGVFSGEEFLREAIKRLAGVAADGLGHSPAKYGPLSGKGWSFYRGESFSKDWAKGIASQANSVEDAVTGAAKGASVGTEALNWNEQLTRTIKDLQEFSDLGKHLLDLGKQIADVTFNTLKMANDWSGGRLFPKTYRPIPGFQKGGSAITGWNPTRNPNMGNVFPLANTTGRRPGWFGGAANRGGTPKALGANSSKQDIANYIIQKAMSVGYSRDQANQFVIQAFGESGLSPTAYNKSGWSGIFQFDVPTWALAGGGDVMNAQQNIDNYFRLAKIRGLTPESFTAGSQLGTQVSIGGPWHPQNAAKGHLEAAKKGAQQYIENYAGAVNDAAVEVVTTTGSKLQNLQVPPAILKDLLPGVKSQTAAQVTAGVIAAMFPAITEIQGSGPRPYNKGTHDVGRAIDVFIPNYATAAGKALGDQINDFVRQHHDILGIDYTIWKDTWKNFSGGVSEVSGHMNHIDIQFKKDFIPNLTSLGADLSNVNLRPSPLSTSDSQALSDTATNTSSLPSMSSSMRELVNNDPILYDAVNNQSKLTQESVVPVLQHLDSLIAEQNQIGTPESKIKAQQLGQYKTQLQSSFGLEQGPDALETASTIMNGAMTIVTDIFGVVDASLESIAAAQEISSTLVRGIANTEDIYRIVDQVQSFLTLGSRIAQLVGSATGFAAQIVGMAGTGDTSGGASAAAMALGAISGIASTVAQVYEIINTSIDIAQEVYRITGKYVGRIAQSVLGLTGASDVKFLLDTVTGQLQAYSSENPQNKTTMNTLGRQLGGGRERPTATNNFTIYQGPGQDPRDTMNDAMFLVRSSGAGVFGYE